MEAILNQTIYKCSYCPKRTLTKRGAKIHESEYCKGEGSPSMVSKKEKQALCNHEDVGVAFTWSERDGVRVPDYEVCVDCDLVL